MQKLLIANWKMNPRTEREAVVLARASDANGVVICPPFPFIPAVAKVLRRASLGAQNAFPGVTGARTGEVSAGELRAAGVRYVILGHSERRTDGERDAAISKKVAGVIAAGLTPILCVGEPWSVRKRGIAAARAYVKRQLAADLATTKNLKLETNNLLIAYEPVWAISTNREYRDPSTGLRVNETPEDAAAMASFIKKFLVSAKGGSASGGKSYKFKVNVLYGGSVNAKNALSFLARSEFAGVLVGGASLKPAEFKKVIAVMKR